ncbi:hypothetical protein KAU15_06615, partial [candidate division WOR-3 bacterium]|nr:hypothetical protein [candidate division WOR-3 bacterium]
MKENINNSLDYLYDTEKKKMGEYHPFRLYSVFYRKFNDYISDKEIKINNMLDTSVFIHEYFHYLANISMGGNLVEFLSIIDKWELLSQIFTYKNNKIECSSDYKVALEQIVCFVNEMQEKRRPQGGSDSKKLFTYLNEDGYEEEIELGTIHLNENLAYELQITTYCPNKPVKENPYLIVRKILEKKLHNIQSFELIYINILSLILPDEISNFRKIVDAFTHKFSEERDLKEIRGFFIKYYEEEIKSKYIDILKNSEKQFDEILKFKIKNRDLNNIVKNLVLKIFKTNKRRLENPFFDVDFIINNKMNDFLKFSKELLPCPFFVEGEHNILYPGNDHSEQQPIMFISMLNEYIIQF